MSAPFTFEAVNRAINSASPSSALVGVDEEAGTGALVKAAGFGFDHGVTLALIRKIDVLLDRSRLVFLASARKEAVKKANVMKKLIVNADDFGLTNGVNRAIIEGHARGAITSATLMANMPAFDAAVRLAKDHPSLGVGLHFNITGTPVADASRVGSPIDDSGEFWGTSQAVWAAMLAGAVEYRRGRHRIARHRKGLNAGLRLTQRQPQTYVRAASNHAAIISTIKDYGSTLSAPREGWRFDRDAGSFKPIVRRAPARSDYRQLCRIGT